MKTLFLLCLALLSFSACKDESTSSALVGAGSMSAKIDGADWTASLTVQATQQNGVIAIAGQDAQIRQIQLRVMGATAPGEYAISTNTTATVSTGTSANDVYSASLVAGSGKVIFTTLTSTDAEGTFSFTGRNTAGGTKSVTNGSFKVKF